MMSTTTDTEADMAAKPLSEKRRDMAAKVGEGVVRYHRIEPRPWLVDGAPVGGWLGRTLHEMRTDGLIAVAEDPDDSGAEVSLTELGQESLDMTPKP